MSLKDVEDRIRNKLPFMPVFNENNQFDLGSIDTHYGVSPFMAIGGKPNLPNRIMLPLHNLKATVSLNSDEDTLYKNLFYSFNFIVHKYITTNMGINAVPITDAEDLASDLEQIDSGCEGTIGFMPINQWHIAQNSKFKGKVGYSKYEEDLVHIGREYLTLDDGRGFNLFSFVDHQSSPLLAVLTREAMVIGDLHLVPNSNNVDFIFQIGFTDNTLIRVYKI